MNDSWSRKGFSKNIFSVFWEPQNKYIYDNTVSIFVKLTILSLNTVEGIKYL